MANKQLVYGTHTVTRLLKIAPHRVIEVYLLSNKREIVELTNNQGISVQTVSKAKIDAWCDGAVHQGVVAFVKEEAPLTEDDLLALLKQDISNAKEPLILILDEVQDPHNLGAILRTADAAKVTAVVVPKDHSVGITPVVRKVASGAADTVPFVRVQNLARFLQEMQQLGVWVVGLAAEEPQLPAAQTAQNSSATLPNSAFTNATLPNTTLPNTTITNATLINSIFATDLTGARALILGAEGKGLRQLTRKHCDYMAYIPMLGQIESLNVSVAAGICLFEAVRQRLK